jgi:hypothetical protein
MVSATLPVLVLTDAMQLPWLLVSNSGLMMPQLVPLMLEDSHVFDCGVIRHVVFLPQDQHKMCLEPQCK